MGRFISMDFLCQEENCQFALYKEIIEREEESQPRACPQCGGNMVKAYLSAPGITNHSFVDGTRRKNFQDLKEANRLEILKANSRKDKHREIQTEINKLKSVKK